MDLSRSIRAGRLRRSRNFFPYRPVALAKEDVMTLRLEQILAMAWPECSYLRGMTPPIVCAGVDRPAPAM